MGSKKTKVGLMGPSLGDERGLGVVDLISMFIINTAFLTVKLIKLKKE